MLFFIGFADQNSLFVPRIPHINHIKIVLTIMV